MLESLVRARPANPPKNGHDNPRDQSRCAARKSIQKYRVPDAMNRVTLGQTVANTAVNVFVLFCANGAVVERAINI